MTKPSRRHLLAFLVALGACAAPPAAVAPPSPAASPSKVLFVLTSHDKKGDKPSGYYLPEAAHPYTVLTRAGFAVDFASPKGGAPPMDAPDTIDDESAAFLADPRVKEKLSHTLVPQDIVPTEYAAIFYVGGHAAMWDLPNQPELAAVTTAIDARGGVVAAVCHGPAGLVNVKRADGTWLVAGKDVAAFTNDEERAVALDGVIPFFLADALEKRGARHHQAKPFEPEVVVSGRLVTGQNPASARGVAEEMVKLLRAPR